MKKQVIPDHLIALTSGTGRDIMLMRAINEMDSVKSRVPRKLKKRIKATKLVSQNQR